MRKRRGAALALSLVLLALAGGMVAISLDLVERITETTGLRIDDELMLNAAVSGVERGKALLEARRLSVGRLPRRDEPESVLSAGEMLPPFDALKVAGCVDYFVTLNGVVVHVTVYDLSYEVASGVFFLQGTPPRISPERASILASLAEEALQRQGYASANLAGASSASPSEAERSARAYLVRAVAASGFLSKTAEQALVLWE